MKRLPIIIAFMMLSLLSFAQLEIDYNYLNQQQKEIGSIIKADVEAQARQNMLKAQQNQTQLGQGQTQTRQGQTSQQQAIQDFNNRISIEGQQRMEYYNNPDNYIDRSITNRSSSAIIPDERYNTQNQPRDIRREPIHSENLTSKSLQMLREANREYFSNEDNETAIDPNARVPLFDAPSLDAPSTTPVEIMDMEAVYAELSPKQKETYDKKKKEIIERKEKDLLRAEVFFEISKEIKSEMFGSGIPDVAGVFYAIMAENIKEKAIAREQEELCQLHTSARETVRNKRKK